MIVGDLILTDFDLKIDNGDFVIGESTAQHQQCLLVAPKASFKQYPKVGVDAHHYLLDERPEDLMREIRLQLTQDGMKIEKMTRTNLGQINIKAFYNE